MQASFIRDKYKRILEEPEQEDSQDQWEIAYAQMAKNRKKKILTENSSNLAANQQNADNSKQLFTLKQKLAQCLSNCKLHCQQIQKLKKQHLMFQQERYDWKESENQLNRKIDEQRNNNNLNLQRIRDLQTQLQEINLKYQQTFVERELQQKQTDFYKTELKKLKEDLQRRERQFKGFQKDFKQFQKFKKENQYLKNDIERLTMLIEDSAKCGKICGDLVKRHFLGKPHRQMEFWYPQQLVGQVQHFLKKNQVGYGNKEFTSNLVKFIEKLSEKSTKEDSKGRQGMSNSCKQREKDFHSVKKPLKLNIFELSSKKQSFNIGSMRQDCILKSQTNSFWKTNQSRITTNGATTTGLGFATLKSQCWDIINEFRTIVFQLLLEKEIKRKKIKRLLDSMISNVMQLLQGNLQGREFFCPHQNKNQFSHIRFSTEQTHK